MLSSALRSVCRELVMGFVASVHPASDSRKALRLLALWIKQARSTIEPVGLVAAHQSG
jgi:hypothetical protein